MATLNIPTPAPGVGKHFVRVDLEPNIFWRIIYRYSGRDGTWYFDLASDAGIALVRNRRLVLGVDMLAQSRHLAIPQGVFSLVDTTGENLQPLKDELGDRVKFRYTQVDA